ncbi:uncharacterized protein EV422DRAFT_596999 [Fimicolochytrium jonesii]|uniref:uncharacterized protein n=1 Tax=Fimicolochytrium jonesii TaxID=1396493 RepID=UPI0022FE9583|nr:uncharacterized protein EV422DRAFT_596999 [Fimicolochytrium jonesii]KAI8820135.1 hypothetical protein EV422DRAFT_596999 [Fimicolochytrium jonesii]
MSAHRFANPSQPVPHHQQQPGLPPQLQQPQHQQAPHMSYGHQAHQAPYAYAQLIPGQPGAVVPGPPPPPYGQVVEQPGGYYAPQPMQQHIAYGYAPTAPAPPMNSQPYGMPTAPSHMHQQPPQHSYDAGQMYADAYALQGGVVQQVGMPAPAMQGGAMYADEWNAQNPPKKRRGGKGPSKRPSKRQGRWDAEPGYVTYGDVAMARQPMPPPHMAVSAELHDLMAPPLEVTGVSHMMPYMRLKPSNPDAAASGNSVGNGESRPSYVTVPDTGAQVEVKMSSAMNKLDAMRTSAIALEMARKAWNIEHIEWWRIFCKMAGKGLPSLATSMRVQHKAALEPVEVLEAAFRKDTYVRLVFLQSLIQRIEDAMAHFKERQARAKAPQTGAPAQDLDAKIDSDKKTQQRLQTVRAILNKAHTRTSSLCNENDVAIGRLEDAIKGIREDRVTRLVLSDGKAQNTQTQVGRTAKDASAQPSSGVGDGMDSALNALETLITKLRDQTKELSARTLLAQKEKTVWDAWVDAEQRNDALQEQMQKIKEDLALHVQAVKQLGSHIHPMVLSNINLPVSVPGVEGETAGSAAQQQAHTAPGQAAGSGSTVAGGTTAEADKAQPRSGASSESVTNIAGSFQALLALPIDAVGGPAQTSDTNTTAVNDPTSSYTSNKRKQPNVPTLSSSSAKRQRSAAVDDNKNSESPVVSRDTAPVSRWVPPPAAEKPYISPLRVCNIPDSGRTDAEFIPAAAAAAAAEPATHSAAGNNADGFDDSFGAGGAEDSFHSSSSHNMGGSLNNSNNEPPEQHQDETSSSFLGDFDDIGNQPPDLGKELPADSRGGDEAQRRELIKSHQKIKELSTRISQLEAQLSEESAVSTTRGELCETLREEKARITTELEKQHRRFDRAEQEHQERARAADARWKKDNDLLWKVKAQLFEAHERIDDLHREHETKGRPAADFDAERLELSGQITELSGAKEMLEERERELLDEIEENKIEIAQIRQDALENKNKVMALEAEAVATAAAMEEMRAQTDAMSKIDVEAAEKCRKELVETKEIIAGLTKEKDDLGTKNAENEKRIGDLEAAIGEKTALVETLKQEMETKAVAHQAELDKLNREAVESTTIISEMQAELNEMVEKIETLHKETKAAEARADECKERIQALLKTIDERADAEEQRYAEIVRGNKFYHQLQAQKALCLELSCRIEAMEMKRFEEVKAALGITDSAAASVEKAADLAGEATGHTVVVEKDGPGSPTPAPAPLTTPTTTTKPTTPAPWQLLALTQIWERETAQTLQTIHTRENKRHRQLELVIQVMRDEARAATAARDTLIGQLAEAKAAATSAQQEQEQCRFVLEIVKRNAAIAVNDARARTAVLEKRMRALASVLGGEESGMQVPPFSQTPQQQQQSPQQQQQQTPQQQQSQQMQDVKTEYGWIGSHDRSRNSVERDTTPPSSRRAEQRIPHPLAQAVAAAASRTQPGQQQRATSVPPQDMRTPQSKSAAYRGRSGAYRRASVVQQRPPHPLMHMVAAVDVAEAGARAAAQREASASVPMQGVKQSDVFARPGVPQHQLTPTVAPAAAPSTQTPLQRQQIVPMQGTKETDVFLRPTIPQQSHPTPLELLAKLKAASVTMQPAKPGEALACTATPQLSLPTALELLAKLKAAGVTTRTAISQPSTAPASTVSTPTPAPTVAPAPEAKPVKSSTPIQDVATTPKPLFNQGGIKLVARGGSVPPSTQPMNTITPITKYKEIRPKPPPESVLPPPPLPKIPLSSPPDPMSVVKDVHVVGGSVVGKGNSGGVATSVAANVGGCLGMTSAPAVDVTPPTKQFPIGEIEKSVASMVAALAGKGGARASSAAPGPAPTSTAATLVPVVPSGPAVAVAPIFPSQQQTTMALPATTGPKDSFPAATTDVANVADAVQKQQAALAIAPVFSSQQQTRTGAPATTSTNDKVSAAVNVAMDAMNAAQRQQAATGTGVVTPVPAVKPVSLQQQPSTAKNRHVPAVPTMATAALKQDTAQSPEGAKAGPSSR